MSGIPAQRREELYETAVREYGRMIDRLAAGYEGSPDKRHDLRQEIHLQLWRSLARFDERCSLKTWTLRVAHNTAVSHVAREHRAAAVSSRWVTIEELEQTAANSDDALDTMLDRQQALERLMQFIRELKPLDRQILLSYLEQIDAASIAEITGLSPANVAMKIHRIKAILARRFQQLQNREVHPHDT